MKISKRGQVTIPKSIRDRFGLAPHTKVELEVIQGAIVLRKKPKKLGLKEWKRHCLESFSELGFKDVDDSIRFLRGK